MTDEVLTQLQGYGQVDLLAVCNVSTSPNLISALQRLSTIVYWSILLTLVLVFDRNDQLHLL